MLTWLVLEWKKNGKPTAVGAATGIVVGLVGVTPAAGFIYPWAGLIIGVVTAIVLLFRSSAALKDVHSMTHLMCLHVTVWAEW